MRVEGDAYSIHVLDDKEIWTREVNLSFLILVNLFIIILLKISKLYINKLKMTVGHFDTWIWI